MWSSASRTFRRWATSEEFPDQGRFAFLNGNVWMDLTMEHAFSHNQVKGAINAALTVLVQQEDIGLYFPDGMLLSNTEAALSTVPDGVFVTLPDQRQHAFVVRGDGLLRWSTNGYDDERQRPRGIKIEVLTPPAIIAVLAAGYRPQWHPSAE